MGFTRREAFTSRNSISSLPCSCFIFSNKSNGRPLSCWPFNQKHVAAVAAAADSGIAASVAADGGEPPRETDHTVSPSCFRQHGSSSCCKDVCTSTNDLSSSSISNCNAGSCSSSTTSSRTSTLCSYSSSRSNISATDGSCSCSCSTANSRRNPTNAGSSSTTHSSRLQATAAAAADLNEVLKLEAEMSTDLSRDDLREGQKLPQPNSQQ